MAPTRQFEHEAQVSSSSSEEDEEASSSSEDNGEAESEEEADPKSSPSTPTPIPTKDKKPLAMKKPETSQTPAQPQASSSSSESESGSESDSDSGDLVLRARKADLNVKPIASKPMEEQPSNSKAAAAKKPRSKSSAPPASETPVKSSRSVSKRANESEKSRDSKKAKSEVTEDDTAKKTENDTKKQLFQRLWSEEDELNILKGMVEYMEKKGADPVADMNAFHEFVKDRVHIEVTKTQLADKVRRLKKKYENNASKGKKGEDRTFSKAHEQKAFELSKKVWGPEANSVVLESPKVNGKANKTPNKRNGGKASVSAKAELVSSPEVTKMEIERNHHVSAPSPAPFSGSSGNLSVEEEIIRDGLELISGDKRKELDDKWRKLRVEEIELYSRRSALIQEQTKLVLEALKARR